MDEGVIKYSMDWKEAAPVDAGHLKEIIRWRQYFHHLGLIGEYENGIGFGNLSFRESGAREFIISGSQTGGIAEAGPEHFVRITDFDIDQNSVRCEGPMKASSEAMTHAMIYTLDPEILGVLHVHHLPLWEKLMDLVPTSGRDVPYGTPAMAKEAARLYKHGDLRREKILIMAGHEEGIITFGSSLEEAARVLLMHFNM